MTPEPVVSVVVPTYQRSELIVRAVRSALAQDTVPLEVLVVDDASHDDTASRIAALGDPRVRHVVRPVRGGPAAARNDGIDLARGEFIAFLDSDDEWLPGKLDLQLRCLERLPEVGMVWSDIEVVDDEGRRRDGGLAGVYAAWRDRSPDDVFTSSTPLDELKPDAAGRLWSGDILAPMLRGNLVHTSTVVLRRSRLESVGRFDPNLVPSGEDYDFHLRTAAAGPVAFVDVATIRYRFGAADQLTSPPHHVALARNFVIALSKATTAYRGDPRVSPRLLRRALADAHAWHGEELLAIGDRGKARSELVRSLIRPRLRRSALLAAALLPGALTDRLRRSYSRLRTPTRSRGGR